MFGERVVGPEINGARNILHQGDGPDARLIASAPELLEALEAILANPDLSRNDWDKETMAVLTQARTAIAKAKGETL